MAGHASCRAITEMPREGTDHEFPFVLTTGRLYSHWHTLTRTAKCDKLVRREPEPYVELNPEDAGQLGMAEGEIVQVSSRRGTIRLPARLSDAVPPGTVFLPFHWGDLYAPDNAVNYLTIGAIDAVSRQPELKFCAVALEKVGPPQRAPVSARHCCRWDADYEFPSPTRGRRCLDKVLRNPGEITSRIGCMLPLPRSGCTTQPGVAYSRTPGRGTRPRPPTLNGLHNGACAILQPFQGWTKGLAALAPGVREYATPGCVVQPLRGKDRVKSVRGETGKLFRRDS